MKIKPKKVTIRELCKKYLDNQEDGIFGLSGKLNIRPQYQREYVYPPEKRDAVIETVFKNYPLNAMYWANLGKGKYEIIDGQQRTVSICKYINSEFSYKKKYFHNLRNDQKKKILDYKLMVYDCSGSDSEKLEWFKTVNIAGLVLSDQELRNAVYHGSWVSNAKIYFSKSGCPAYGIASDYIKGSLDRQAYLEIAIKWISKNKIEEYMAKNQNIPKAIKLWNHFSNIISWVDSTFTNKRKIMSGIDWGELYDNFSNQNLDSEKIEKEIIDLIEDEDVTNHRGVYHYVLFRDEKYLNIRPFNDQIKRRVYEKQKGICNNKKCKKKKTIFKIDEMEADHIKPWIDGGKTEERNCQMLCKDCNRRKSSK